MSQFICIPIPEIPDPPSITLPGGVTMGQINLMEIIQPALTPLVPVFDLVDAVVAVFDCLKAVTDPVELAKRMPELGRKVSKLLRLMPQVSVPMTIVGIIDLVVDALRQARSQILHLQQQMVQITGVMDRAAQLNDPGLLAVAQCAQGNVAQEAANVGRGLASLGRLIGLVNLLMGLVGGPEQPNLSSVAGRPLEQAVEPIDNLIAVFARAREAVPIP